MLQTLEAFQPLMHIETVSVPLTETNSLSTCCKQSQSIASEIEQIALNHASKTQTQNHDRLMTP